jgi:hypothetical protein
MILRALAFILATLQPLAQFAHDGGDEFGEWYKSLRTPEGGTSCCSERRDCKQVTVYRGTTDGYEVMFEGAWLAVPWRVVLSRKDNPTGLPVLCVMFVDGKPKARCFVRGTEG